MPPDPAWRPLRLADGSTWLLHPQLAEGVADQPALPLERWLAAGQAAVVKQGPHRIVYRVELPGLSFHLKRNLIPNWRARVRGWLRGPKARREFDLIRRVADRGIPAAETLGWGSLRRAGESFLFTRTLDRVEPLHLFFLLRFLDLPCRQQAMLRQRLARELGALIARMHRAGIEHGDLHAGNLLVRFDDNQPHLFVIDLDAVRLTSPLVGERRLASLAMLNAWFRMHAERSDRMRFWKSYVEADPFLPWKRFGLDAISIASELERRSAAYSLELWSGRLGRCLGANRYFRSFRGNGATGHAMACLDPARLDRILANPETAKECSESGAPMEWSPAASADVALRRWVAGHAFRERGLPTATPAAVLLSPHAASGLVLEKLDPAATPFDVAWESARSGAKSVSLRRRLTVRLARAYRDLHDRGMLWTEPRLDAVRVSPADEDAPSDWTFPNPPSLFPRVRRGVWFADLTAMCPVAAREAGRRSDLARLADAAAAASRTDCLRFLRSYLGWGLDSEDDWKTWWRSTAGQMRRAAGK